MKIIQWDGEPVSTPGWYSGVPIERYHSAGMCVGPSVSSSNLRTCWDKSEAHMFDQWCENPNARTKTASRSMQLGAVAHHLLLGEDNFALKYIAQPEEYPDRKTGELKPWNYNANHCKDWRDEQHAAGKIVTNTKDLDAVIEMSKSLALDGLVNDGLLRGYVETSGFFVDDETGLWIKVRPDVIPQTDDTFVDLKTTSDITSRGLQRSITGFGYNQQGGLIWEACEALDHPFKMFALMFVETSSPYCARTVPLAQDDLSRGRLQNRSELRKIARCIEAGRWPGPGDGMHFEIPISQRDRDFIDARLKREGLA